MTFTEAFIKTFR